MNNLKSVSILSIIHRLTLRLPQVVLVGIIALGSLMVVPPNPVHAFSAGNCITHNRSFTPPSAGARAGFAWMLTTPIYWKCDTGDPGQWDGTYGGYFRLPTNIDYVTIDNYYDIDMGGIAPTVRGLTINPNGNLNLANNRLFIDTSMGGAGVTIYGAFSNSNHIIFTGGGSATYYNSYASLIVDVGDPNNALSNANITFNSPNIYGVYTLIYLNTSGSNATNNGTIYNATVGQGATFSNNGTATDGIYVNSGGTATNYLTTGRVQNSGTFTNWYGSTISGDISNYSGNFYNYSSNSIGNLSNSSGANFYQYNTMFLRNGNVYLYGSGFNLNSNALYVQGNSYWDDRQGMTFQYVNIQGGGYFYYAYNGSTYPKPALTINQVDNSGYFYPESSLNVSINTLNNNSGALSYYTNDWVVGTLTNYGNLQANGTLGTLTVNGNYSDYGTFTNMNSLSMVLNGGSNTFNSGYSIKSLTKNGGGTINFKSGATFSPSNSLSLSGSSVNNPLYLRSTSGGTYWNLTPPGTLNLNYLDVMDSNATSQINALGPNNWDSGHNVNWQLSDHMTSLNVPASGTYYGNDNLTFTVNWLNPVTITGTPRLPLTIDITGGGSATRYATYTSSGSTTSASKFVYSVQGTDLDSNGIVVGNALDLNGGGATIKDIANNANAILSTVGVGGTGGVNLIGSYLLTVNITFCSGSGSVDLNPPSADFRYMPATVVSLSASAGSGSSFAGWNGYLSGLTTPQNVTMDTNRSVSACFELTGTGYVDSSYGPSTPGWGVTRFASINTAIATVPSATTIYVAAGTYPGDVTMNKNVTLAPAAGVIINGNLTQTDGVISAPAGNLTISGNYLLNGGTFTGDASGTLTLGGNFTHAASATFNSGNLVNFTGSSPVITGASTFTNLNMSGSGTLTSTEAINVTSTLTINSGKVHAYTGSTLNAVDIKSGAELLLDAGETLTIGSLTNAGTFSPAGGTANITGSLTNSGTFSPTGGIVNVDSTFTNSGTVAPTGGTLNLAGNLVNNGSFSTSGTSLMTFDGSGDQTISGSQPVNCVNMKVNSGGTVSASTPVNVSDTLTIQQGTFDASNNSSINHLVVDSGAHFTLTGGETISIGDVANSGDFSPSGGTVNISGTLTNSGTFDPSGGLVTVGGDFTNSPSGSFSPSAGSLLLGGNLVNNGTFTPGGTSGITFDGSANQHIGGSNAVTFNDLTINNTSKTSVIDSSKPITVNGTTNITRGILKPADGSVFKGNVTIGANGTLDGSAATTSGVSFGGDFTNNGAFTAGSGLVTFNGTAAQSIGGSTSPTTFNNLAINNPGHTVTGNLRTDAANLTVTSGTFAPADGSTFDSVDIQAGGALALTGTETVHVTHNLNNAGVLSPTGGTLDIGGDLHNLGTGHIAPSGGTINTVGNFTNDGTFNPSAGTFDLGGNLINNGTFAPTGGTFNFDGSGSQSISGSSPVSFASLVISNPNGVSGLGAITGNDLTIPTGVNYTPPAGSQFKNVTIDSGGTLSMPSGGNIDVSGNWTNNGTFNKGTNSTVTFDGSGAQSIGGSSVTNFGNLVINNSGGTVTGNTAASADALTVKNGTFVPAGGSSFGSADIQSGAQLDITSGTVQVLHNLSNEGTIVASGGSLNVGGNFDNSSLLTISGGTVAVGGTFTNETGATEHETSGNLNLAGNLVNNGTFNCTGGTVTMDGSADQVISGSTSPTTFNNLVINNPGHTVTGNVRTDASNLTVTSGTFDPSDGSTFGSVDILANGILTLTNGETIHITNDLNNAGKLSPSGGTLDIGGNWNNSGEFNASGGTVNLTGDLTNSGIYDPSSGTVNIDGDFTNTGTGSFIPSGGLLNLAGNLLSDGIFNPTGGTVTLDGSGPQTIDGASNPFNFYNLDINSIGPVDAKVPLKVKQTLEILQGQFTPTSGSDFNVVIVDPGGQLNPPSSGPGITINAPVLANPIPDQVGQQGSPFSFTFDAGTFTVQSGSMTYTATKNDGSPLPAWLIFTPATRNFSGTSGIGDTGPLQVKVTAHNGGSGTASDTFYITIRALSGLPPVLVYPVGDQQSIEGTPFSYTFPADTFFDPDGGSLIYRTDGLPQWLTFSTVTRTFSGTPVSGAAAINSGDLPIVLTADNSSGGSASSSFTIHVSPLGAHVPPSLHERLVDQQAVMGTLFNYQVPASFAVNSETGDTLTYSATLEDGSPLPAWVSFDGASHTFSGTPSTPDIGTGLVKVTVTNSHNLAVSDLFRLSVSSSNSSVVYLGLSPQGLTNLNGFSSVTIPPGIVPAGGHYYLEIMLSQPVPVAIAGYVDTLLGRQISLFDGNGNPVTTLLNSPATVCFQLTQSQWDMYSNDTLSIVTSPNLTTDWTLMETKAYPISLRVCADAKHFSLFNLLAMPPASGGVETGFAPNRQTILPKQPTSQAYEQMGNLWFEIPTLGIKENIVGVPMVNGKFDVSWLGNQIGWLDSTAYPGLAGYSVLTGHVYDANGQPGSFRWLARLTYNDDVIVHINGQRLIYRVRSVVEQADPDTLWKGIKHEQNPWVMLITCRGYDEKTNTYRWRTVVRAVLVDTTVDQ